MKEAFTYMFKDNKYPQKAFVYFLFIFIAGFFTQYANTFVPMCKNCLPPVEYYVSLILGTVLMFIPQGYYISCIRALTDQKDNYVLPSFNVLKNLLQGFKFGISCSLPCLTIGLISIIITILLTVLTNISYFFIIGLIILFLIIIALIFVFCFYAIALTVIYSKTGSWLSFFKFKQATKIIADNMSNYMITIGLTIGISMITGTLCVSIPSAVCTLLECNKIIAPLISAVLSAGIGSYTIFVFSYILAKCFETE